MDDPLAGSWIINFGINKDSHQYIVIGMNSGSLLRHFCFHRNKVRPSLPLWLNLLEVTDSSQNMQAVNKTPVPNAERKTVP